MHGAPSSWPDRGALSAVGTRCPSSLCFHLRAESTSTGTGTSSHGDAAPSRRPEGQRSCTTVRTTSDACLPTMDPVFTTTDPCFTTSSHGSGHHRRALFFPSTTGFRGSEGNLSEVRRVAPSGSRSRMTRLRYAMTLGSCSRGWVTRGDEMVLPVSAPSLHRKKQN